MTQKTIYVFTECAFIQDYDAARRLWDSCRDRRYLLPHEVAVFPLIASYSQRQWMDGGWTVQINLEGLISLAREGYTIQVVDSAVKVHSLLKAKEA